MYRHALDAQRGQVFRKVGEEAGERMFIKKGEIQVGEGKGFDVPEGGEVVIDASESIRDDPFELVVLGEVQETNVVARRPQASQKPRLEGREGVQLETCEEMAAASMNPVD